MNQFPYTNFHDVNLDWLIKQTGENTTDITHVESEITTINSEIDALQNEIENISSLYLCTFGVTTNSEIESALNDKKLPICIYNGHIYVISQRVSANRHRFGSVYRTESAALECLLDSWLTQNDTFASTTYVDSAIAAIPSDVFVAVYDETSYADLLAAYNAGKHIVMKRQDDPNEPDAIYAVFCSFESDEFFFYDMNPSTRNFNRYRRNATNWYIQQQGTLALTTSPHFSGVPTAPTAATGTDTTQIASTEFVQQEINNLIGVYDKNSFAFSIQGFNFSNTAGTANANAPFVYHQSTFDYTNYKVYSIILNVQLAGTITIGTIKQTDAVQGQTGDRNNLIIKEILSTTVTGYQEIFISNPFSVGADEFLFIGNNTDTAKWYYGNTAIDKYFLYLPGTTWTATGSSVGITVKVIKTEKTKNIREGITSIYKNKTLSILGDSISTYSGAIPSGNATYYPTGTIASVSDTWWGKLILALGMNLNMNNSWSGSYVTTVNGATSAGCGDRAEDLGTAPDVIIVYMGINDFNNEVPIGTYDGKTAVPSTTTTFREAYGVMLDKILTKYKNAEVWVCTLPQEERNSPTGFPEINGNGDTISEFNEAIKELAFAFGVKVLDHAACGLTYQNMSVFNPDNLHPNKYGHSLLANNDIRTMDNAVSTRYEIS